MAESLDLAALPETTTTQPTDLLYVRRGMLDHRMSATTLFGGLAPVNHDHVIATASNAGFMSAAQAAKLASIDPTASSYVLPTGSATVKGGFRVGAYLGVDGNGALFVASLPPIDSGDITDFTAATKDVVGGMLVGTGTVTTTYNQNGTVTINGVAGTPPAHTHTTSQITNFLEDVQDVVGGMVVGAGTVTVGYNDSTGALTITGAAGGGGGGATTTSGLSDYVEATQDLVGNMVQVSAPLTYTYDDAAGKANLGFSMPIAGDATLGAVRIDPAFFSVSPTGVLSFIGQTGGGGTTGPGIPRLVTVEDPLFGGSLGAGKTAAQRIANTAAFNAALAYCRDNKFALFITPGTWEIAASNDPGVTQHIVQDNGTNDTAVHVFGHRSIIRQHTTGKSIWEMRGRGGSLSGVTLTYAATQTTGDAPLDAGKVKTITVTFGGTGYTSAPTVTITNAGGGAPIAATATAVVSGGAVTSVNIVARGSGYTTAPAISFSGGGGNGAAARAEIYAPHSALILNGTTMCSVRNVRTEYAWTGLHGPLWADNAANTIDTFSVANPNGYGVAWSNGTGNAWTNIQVTGEGASPPVPCVSAVWFNNHSNSSVSKLAIDSLDCQHAIRQTGARGISYGGVNIDNCRPRQFNATDRIAGLISLETDSQTILNGLTINGTDMNTAGGTASPTKLHIFGFRNGARADVTGLRVTNTRNKGAGQEIALIGPVDADVQSHRGVRFSFRAATADRSATTPNLIDRLSSHVIDTTGEDRQSGLVEYNSVVGGTFAGSADWGDTDVTIYPDLHGQVQQFVAPLTTNRIATVWDRIAPVYGSSGQYMSPLLSRGARQSIIRLPEATGAFSLTVRRHDAVTLAVLAAPGDRVDLLYDGVKWVVVDSAVQLTGTPGSLMGFDSAGAAAVVPNTRAISIPLTAETGVLTAGTAKYRFHQPFAFRVTGVSAGLNKASTSGAVTFDVLVNGATILGTKIGIPQGAETSTSGAASTLSIAAAAAVSVNVDAAGTGAEGAKVYIIGYPT